VVNREEVKQEIVSKLQEFVNLKSSTVYRNPLIYHVDVAAMYPNIILSNRLQPVAIVNDEICATCVYNKEANDCKRKMEWQWKGNRYPLSRKEYDHIKKQLIYEEEAHGR
jgi:DNA polymerase epsilon subunit 1